MMHIWEERKECGRSHSRPELTQRKSLNSLKTISWSWPTAKTILRTLAPPYSSRHHRLTIKSRENLVCLQLNLSWQEKVLAGCSSVLVSKGQRSRAVRRLDWSSLSQANGSILSRACSTNGIKTDWATSKVNRKTSLSFIPNSLHSCQGPPNLQNT